MEKKRAEPVGAESQNKIEQKLRTAAEGQEGGGSERERERERERQREREMFGLH